MHFPSHVIFLLFLSSLAASVINCVQRGVGEASTVEQTFCGIITQGVNPQYSYTALHEGLYQLN